MLTLLRQPDLYTGQIPLDIVQFTCAQYIRPVYLAGIYHYGRIIYVLTDYTKTEPLTVAIQHVNSHTFIKTINTQIKSHNVTHIAMINNELFIITENQGKFAYAIDIIHDNVRQVLTDDPHTPLYHNYNLDYWHIIRNDRMFLMDPMISPNIEIYCLSGDPVGKYQYHRELKTIIDVIYETKWEVNTENYVQTFYYDNALHHLYNDGSMIHVPLYSVMP